MSLHISLAPFMGITSKIYRNAYVRHFPGLDQVYAPFISGVHPVKVNLSKFDDVLPFEDNVIETIPQFVSIDADEVIAMGRTLASHGYTHMNWNMGCPFSRLANKMRGCGILPYPDQVRKLLDVIMPQLPIQLSIKTRLGYYSTDELSVIIEILNQYPIKELIIHPRIGKQLYSGNTSLKEFGDCLTLSKIPVTYNGDIFHSQRYDELQTQFPLIHSWMIGRGALINPFLASQIKGLNISENEKRGAVRGFHQELYSGLGQRLKHEKRLLGQLKALWYYMSGCFADGKQHFLRLKLCQNSESYLNFVEDLIEQPFADNQQIEFHWHQGLKHVGDPTK
jgi:tRNA-dihydrouridine synthase B